MTEPRWKCPHCGRLFTILIGRLIPIHELPDTLTNIRCPGSQQTPRNTDSDRRPLWKDGGVP